MFCSLPRYKLRFAPSRTSRTPVQYAQITLNQLHVHWREPWAYVPGHRRQLRPQLPVDDQRGAFGISAVRYESKSNGDGLSFGHVAVCLGTKRAISHVGRPETIYRELQRRYTNCTYVDGNLELTFLDNRTNYDLSFLSNIREVGLLSVETAASLRSCSFFLAKWMLPARSQTNCSLHKLIHLTSWAFSSISAS